MEVEYMKPHPFLRRSPWGHIPSPWGASEATPLPVDPMVGCELDKEGRLIFPNDVVTG